MLDTIAADLDTRDNAALAATDNPVARLHGLVDSLLSLHRDRPTALMAIAQEFLDRSARIDTTGVLPLASVVRATVEVIRTGQQHGSIRDGEPLAMTAALHGALLHGCLGRPVYQRTATDSIAPGERFWTAPLARAESAQTCPSDPARSAREAHQRDDAGAGCGEASRRYWDAWPSSLRAGTAGLDQLQCRPRWPICTVRVLGG